jgi:hypothetical protein
MSVTSDPDQTSGDIFLSAHDPEQYGAMILNGRGQLVYFQPGGQVFNFQEQRYLGQPVITWWLAQARGRSEDVILNSSYHRVAVVRAGNGLTADLHEFQITPQGTALLDAVKTAPANLKSVGGPLHGHVSDYVVQELDIKTGKVIWQWDALRHIPIDASEARNTPNTAYDSFHLNSIQQLPGGNLLISARNTWALYEISRSTGKVIWTLGGKDSSFKMRLGTNFAWQHDARLDGSTLSLFDDGANPQVESESSAKVLHINTTTMTVSPVRRYTHSPSLLAISGGSAEILPNGNMFVGWGSEPDSSEYTPNGTQIFNGRFPTGSNSYRAFRYPWNAQPTTPPAFALSPESGGRLIVYASWNGATNVSSWRILGGTSPTQLSALAERPMTGFQTAMTLHSQPAFVAVQALDQSGNVLGTSPTRGDPASSG